MIKPREYQLLKPWASDYDQFSPDFLKCFLCNTSLVYDSFFSVCSTRYQYGVIRIICNIGFCLAQFRSTFPAYSIILD